MDKTGEFRFRLKAGNSHVILIGEAYKTKDRCQKGIESIIENSEDRSRYEIYRDSSGKFRFQLKAGNGEVIGQSHEYTTETSCKKGIELVKKNITAYQIIVLEA
ncbi:MAG TPA: DUF1508 domain-containing protein [Methanospirillum sp.]|nr:DUF1508 domain-containing protein [Methanospirillum sp.]